MARNRLEGGGFAQGVTAEEIEAINRRFGGCATLTGDVSTILANAARRQGFWNKAASVVRDVAGGHKFNDGNKRTAQALVEVLRARNGISTGSGPDHLRQVVQRVAAGELREVAEIAKALRGY